MMIDVAELEYVLVVISTWRGLEKMAGTVLTNSLVVFYDLAWVREIG